jgi:hypothetical protein
MATHPESFGENDYRAVAATDEFCSDAGGRISIEHIIAIA